MKAATDRLMYTQVCSRQEAAVASVFISYSRKDQDFVRKLYDALKAAGRDAWVDFEGIPPSAEWLNEVYAAIDGADTFVFVLSPNSVASEVCGKEVAHAVESKKRIIPIVCRPVGAAEVKAVESLAPLVALNWIFFRESDDFEKAFEQLRFALDTDLDYWHLSSDLLVRAQKWQEGAKNANLTLRGPELAAAERWLTAGADKEPRPTALQLDFISASRKATASRQRRLLAGVSTALIVTLILAVISSVLFGQTQAQNTQLNAKNAALTVKALAGASSDALTNNRVDQALLLGAEAVRRQSTAPEARDALFNALEYSPYLDTVLQGNAEGSDYGRSAEFSADGKLLMSATQSGRITLWDVTKRTQRNQFTAAFSGCHSYYYAALSPDGQTVATLSRGGCSPVGTDLWNAQSGAHLTHLEPVPGGYFATQSGLAFSPDGKVLVAPDEGGFGAWGVHSGHRLGHLPGSGPFFWAVFSPGGSILATGNLRSMSLWSASSLSLIRSFSFGAYGATFSPDGKTLALADGSQINFLNIPSGQLAPTTISQGTLVASSVAFSPDGGRIVFNDFDSNTLQLWDLVNNSPIGAPLQAHSDNVERVVASPDGQHFASIGTDSKVVLWRFVPFSTRSLPLGSNLDGTSAAVFSPDGKLMATCDITTNQLTLWDAQTAAPAGTMSGNAQCFNGVEVGDTLAFSPDGKNLAQEDDTGNIRLWNVQSRTALKDVLALPTGGSALTGAPSVAFSPDGHFLAGVGFSGVAAIWDATSWSQVQAFDHVNSLAFSPDSHILALAVTGSTRGEIHFWNVTSHSVESTLSVTGSAAAVQGVAYSPDGKTLASIDSSGAINFWNLQTGKVDPKQSFTGGASRFSNWYGVIFNPDGKILVAYDGVTIILWDVQTNAQVVRPIFDPRNYYNVAFSPDGLYLVESQANGPVIVRSVTPDGWAAEACRIANRNLTRAEWNQFVGATESYQRTCPDLPAGT